MADMKRTPGRPKGSGKKDGQTLASVADKLVRNPKLRPTAAMRLVIKGRSDWGATPETLLRRLQGKWAKDSAILMEAARERISRVSVPPRSVGAAESLSSKTTIESLQRLADSAVAKAAQGYVQSPAYQRIQAWLNSPNYLAQMSTIEKYARGMIEDPFQKRLLELQKMMGTVPGLDKWGRGLF
jgi:hypothetical protein